MLSQIHIFLVLLRNINWTNSHKREISLKIQDETYQLCLIAYFLPPIFLRQGKKLHCVGKAIVPHKLSYNFLAVNYFFLLCLCMWFQNCTQR